MIILVLVLWCWTANAATLYEYSQGRLGLEFNAMSSPEACKTELDMEPPNWKQCQVSAAELFELHPQQYHYAIWATVAALRADDISSAFDEFEPLLSVLNLDWKEDYWSIVTLEAWLLFEAGLDKEARILLDEIPEGSLAASGKYILLYTEMYSHRSQRKQERFWEKMTEQGLITSWTWWHRIRLSKPNVQPALFQGMLQSKFAGPIQYIDVVRRYSAEQKWQSALLIALNGLSLFPDSKPLYKEAIIIARHEEGRAALGSYLDRFPEHTKALLVQSFVLMMDDQFENAWTILEKAKEYGEHSDIFWGLREGVGLELSTEIYLQVLKEGALTHPNDDTWLQKIDSFEKSEWKIEELRLLRQRN